MGSDVRFHVVTTTNGKGWEETGRRMAQSFVDRWPQETRLTVYAEGFEPDVAGVEARSLPDWLPAFKARHSALPHRNGVMRGAYDYRFDAVKFAHKVAAMTDFGAELDDGVMIWIDADTYTHAQVTPDWLKSLFREPSYIAWLERMNSHPETGFIMFRCSHPYHRNFMQSLEQVYVSDALFHLHETHDAFVIQHMAMAKFHSRKIPAPASLSGDANWHHPFVSGPLGTCLDHCKGPTRKALGRSSIRDLKRPRSEEYWNVVAR